MKRLAIVVQRCGKDVIGGSESYAFQLGTIMSRLFDVDILTTTAKDHFTWKNHFPEGTEAISDKLRIVRFYVEFERSQYWYDLSGMLFKNVSLNEYAALDASQRDRYLEGIKKAPLGLQEEWMKFQGPYSPGLLNYIKENENPYDVFAFMTYLYPTTYFGLDMVKNKNKVFIIPTLHDEPPAYLSLFRKYADYKFLFLTKAEQRLANKILQRDLVADIIGFGMEDKFYAISSNSLNEKYILYAGRLDAAKGVHELFEKFVRFSEKHPDIKLYAIGEGPLKDFCHPNIKYKGFVSESEKYSLMKEAVAFVHPSAFESLGIVLLESFMMATPGLVNKRCEVLDDHIVSSSAGYSYDSYEEFETYLLKLGYEENLKKTLGENGRNYFVQNYSLDHMVEKLTRIFSEKGVSLRANHMSPGQTMFTQPALPLPSNTTEEWLFQFLLSCCVESANPEEMRNYCKSDFRRFLYTLSLVPEQGSGILLELGANPYFTTMLLKKFRQYELKLANYFGANAKNGTQRVFYRDFDGSQKEEVFNFEHFNIETDPFPYESGSMDVILFCEIIEHLLNDPVSVIREIKRVLKRDGVLILTTPNLARLENVAKLLCGANVYDPYSGYGPYGRHNREYIKHELYQLLDYCGFDMEAIFSADVHENHAGTFYNIQKVLPLVQFREQDLGQYIFVRCRNTREAKQKRPSWLYRSYSAGELE